MAPPREKPGGRKPTISQELLRGEQPISRERFVDLSRDYLSVLTNSVVDFRAKGIGGRAFTRDYSRIVDAIVGVLFQRALQDHGAAAATVDIAVIATGGYGREELAPYSDVDLLVLCKRRTVLVRNIAATFIRFMWDVGFELGHSVESLIESEGTLFRHMDSRTALYESRWVCGSRKISREIEDQIKRMRQKDREAFLERKIKDAVTRRENYSNSYQLIEPNVKLSPGGLRDYQTLVWLGMVSHGDVGLSALRRKKLLLPGDAKALEKAYDFLLRVRVELHLTSQSKQDQLTVRMQRAISERLGYRSRGGHLAVELFMRDYYNHTRTIFGIVDEIIEELQAGKNLGILLGRRKVPRGEKRLDVRVVRSRLQKEPLYVFFKQKEAGTRLGRPLKRRLEKLLDEELSGKRQRSLMREQFPDLLSTGRNLSLVLRSMQETGFLAVVIPEYRELTSLKRYDLYHHYTVDEHSFQVVANLEALATPRLSDPLCRIYSELSNKRVLFLTALLHDIGKIEGRGHAKKGAVLSRKILKRIRVKPDDADTVSFLIEHHLLMSHYAQRRDPDDLGTLQTFAAAIEGRTKLKYLTLLTYADLKATSPVVWTEWKRSLLWTLYLKAYEFMTRTTKEPEKVYKAHKQAILRGFSGKERKHALAHLDLLPGRYLLTMAASQVREHMRLIGELVGKTAVVSIRHAEPAAEITFCTIDKPFRLSQLCGVLTVNDCNILFAHAFTRSDGKVLDVFHVQDLSGAADIDDARVENIRADLSTVLRGKYDLNAQVERHMQKWKRRKETRIPIPLKIEFENDISPDMTIIDIFAADEAGLLFRITRALSEEGLVIHRARISTEANRAIDSFDVQDRKGKKIVAAARLRQIRARLLHALAADEQARSSGGEPR